MQFGNRGLAYGGGGVGGHVRHTTQTWCDRMCGALCGAVIGLLLFFGSFPLLVWNEGTAVQTAHSLDEALSIVSVHLSGWIGRAQGCAWGRGRAGSGAAVRAPAHVAQPG